MNRASFSSQPALRVFGITCVLGMLATGAPGATVHHVPAGFPTIQAALDGAAPGDTVEVHEGVYEGQGNRDLDFRGKSLVLIGAGGPAATILDCGGTEARPHRGFFFHRGEGPDSIVRGFTIRNGYASGRNPANYGGGAFCDSSSSPTFEDCWFLDNTSGHFGGGLGCFRDARPTLRRVVFLRNEALNNGGAVGCKFGGAPHMTDVIMADNRAKRGGAVWAFRADLHIEQSTLWGNAASQYGGAIWINDSRVQLVRSIVAETREGTGSLRCSDRKAAFTLIACDVYGNVDGEELPPCAEVDDATFHESPEFLAPEGGDFRLGVESACRGEKRPDGKSIGARVAGPVGSRSL